MTRTWFRFFSAWQYCMQVNICLTARLYSLCRYGGLVVSAVLVRTEHEGSNPGKDQPAPTTLHRHRAGMPPVASGQTGTASLAVQRPTDCTTVAPVAGRLPGPEVSKVSQGFCLSCVRLLLMDSCTKLYFSIIECLRFVRLLSCVGSRGCS